MSTSTPTPLPGTAISDGGEVLVTSGVGEVEDVTAISLVEAITMTLREATEHAREILKNTSTR